MKKCYTIGSIAEISDKYDICQFTENSRVFLTRRNSAQHIKDCRAKGVKAGIIVHQDFIYIASRFSMFSPTVKKSIIDYIKSYDDTDVIGIVMHTDFPVRKEVVNAKDSQSAVDKVYTSNIWNKQFIKDSVNKIDIVETSIIQLATELHNAGVKTKVYLENTTNTGPDDNVSTIDYLINIFCKYPWIHTVYGIAYDTCHQYSVNSRWLSIEELGDIKQNLCDVIVHLNAIPAGVTPGSHKDRHSNTTLSECSVNTIAYYKAYTEGLDKLDIPWVREVKTETIERELQWMQQYQD